MKCFVIEKSTGKVMGDPAPYRVCATFVLMRNNPTAYDIIPDWNTWSAEREKL